MLNIFAAGVAGLLIGILVTKRLMSKEVARAYEKAKKEFEDKKVELSDKIGDQLSDMRSGLVRTLEAYVGAVSVVRENLPISAEKLNELIAPAKLRLSSGNGKHANQEQSIAVEIEPISVAPAAPMADFNSEQKSAEQTNCSAPVDLVDNADQVDSTEQAAQALADQRAEEELDNVTTASKLN